MSQTHDDPRVTAYVFGELPSDQMAAFEQELERSPELSQEVAAIRDAVAALRSEFDAHSAAMSPGKRLVVEEAIQQRAQQLASASTPPPVTPVSAHQRDPFNKRSGIVALLAASVLLAIGLTYPYWIAQSSPEISMTDSSIERAIRDAMPAAEMQASDFAPQPLAAEESLKQSAAVSDLAAQGGGLGGAPAMDAPAIDAPGASGGKGDRAVMFSETDEADPVAEPAMPQLADLSRLRAKTSQSRDASAAAIGSPANDSPALFGDDLGGPRQSSTRGIARPAAAAEDDANAIELSVAAAEAPSRTIPTPQRRAMTVSPNAPQSSAAPATAPTPILDAFQDETRSTSSARRERLEMTMDLDLADTAMPAIVEVESLSRSDAKYSKPSDDPLGMMGGGVDRYAPIIDNPFVPTNQAPLSTFSIDVDTASYAKVRSLLQNNSLPPPDAVRIEELLNYFDYDYPGPQDSHPFAASMEIVQCPWKPDHRLARIGIQAKEIETQRPSSNLVFLLDVSGSMNEPAKLPLVIEGMKLLSDQLTENDRVAIVVYAGAAGVVLESTRGDNKQEIKNALDRLHAGGSTNGGQGIALAYQIARDHFINGGTNRVILCSDGDFNVGVTGTDELIRVAKENAGSNIFLSVLGFGHGNHNDAMMEKLSNDCNGNYAFIDSKREAEKVFVDELAGTLVTVAKDVKIQIEFNPKRVAAYRLIGYENRLLQDDDFENDKIDAGEVGAGHTVTALYELVPADSDPTAITYPEDLRYQGPNGLTERANSDEALVLKLRYKQPAGEISTPMDVPVVDSGKSFLQSDRDLRFAAAVAGFGMLLRNSPHQGNLTFEDVHAIAVESAKGDDFGYRTEFVELVEKARALRGE